MVAVFGLISILSAFLVFAIQPVAAKIALPALGGVPAVWSGCMLFFQATLLLGYLYAKELSARIPVRVQPMVHVGVMVMALAVALPMGFEGGAAIDVAEHPIMWLLAMLLFSVGLPFFVISATAPLIQRWFSFTRHKDAANPYFLYAASNIGSMGALLLYPVVIEPYLTLQNQLRLWESAVLALLAAFVVAGLLLVKNCRPDAERIKEEEKQALPPSWQQRGIWLVYSFVPASLLYGVTAYITTDLTPMPMLWVLPLALYLLTFVLVFSSRARGVKLAQELHVPVVLVMLVLMSVHMLELFVSIVYLAGFFVLVLSVHGLLAQSKPSARYLAGFYLWMSLGGVLAGLFNTLLAPVVFNDLYELPIILLASCLLFMPVRQMWQRLLEKRWMLLLVLATVMGVWVLAKYDIFAVQDDVRGLVYRGLIVLKILLLLLIYFRFKNNNGVMVLLMAAVMVASFGAYQFVSHEKLLFKERSVFGVSKVNFNHNSNMMQLVHGSTVHGAQAQDERRLQPITYYSQLYDVFTVANMRSQRDDVLQPVAVMGQGVGTLACLAQEKQLTDFFEIDPVVSRIAADERFFTYMRDCPGEKAVYIGDGRAQLRKQSQGKYGIIVMDAFNSDAIPVHLITREAIAEYIERLHPEGIVAVHVSNRYVSLNLPLSSIGNSLGLHVAHKDYAASEEQIRQGIMSSQWVVITPSVQTMQQLEGYGWKTLDEQEEKYIWTDNYSNVFTSMIVVRRLLGLGK